ncbi:MAG: CarD family transcriptional regulator [Thermodesulfobacteriota bacterium]|nr:CarD family transcriptional regulator [Thermodesulfobacteriota bacterium]
MFNVGDMAVYPAHGVGEICNIETRKVGNIEQSFYVLKISDSSMVVMIPTTTSDSVGLRSIIAPSEVDKVFEILQETDVTIEAQPWNQRYRAYMEKIKTGSVYEIAGVLRDLYRLSKDKDLSFGERKMMDTAKSLLTKEISLATKTKEDQVVKNIDQVFV